MRNLTTTVALVALLAGNAIWPATVTAQDNNALRNAIAAQQQQTLEAAGAATEDPVLLTEEELDDLVSPVALYPDPLLAQVLVAAVYPVQVAKADQLIDASADMGEDELSANLEGQDFDPSVLVLMSGFPTVVSRMADDLDWTERLGQAMLAQDEDVLAAVQRMRAASGRDRQPDKQRRAGDRTGGRSDLHQARRPGGGVRADLRSRVGLHLLHPDIPLRAAADHEHQPAWQSTGGRGLGIRRALLVQELFDDDDDHNNNYKNNGGWNDYWSGGRAIDWRDRQFYPRPALYQGPERYTWRQERDRFWDRRAQRWQRNDQALRAYRAGRQDTLEAVMRDRNAQIERMREAAREAKADAAKRYERIQERRQDAAQRAKQERARADSQREDRLKDAKATQKRQEAADAATRQKAKAKAAAQKERWQRAQAQREAEAKAARLEAQRREAAHDTNAKRAQQQTQRAKVQQRQDEVQAAPQKKKEQQARAAQQQRDEADATAQRKKQQQPSTAQRQHEAKAATQKKDPQQSAQKKKQASKQSAQKCKNNPKGKDCKDN